MVNNPNPRKLLLGEYVVRTSADGRTKIENGPIYELAVAKQLLQLHGLVVVNDNAEEDMDVEFIPALEPDELAAIVLALDEARHYDDSECCMTTNGMRIDADGYTIYWNRNKRCESLLHRKTYVKFGFRENNPKCLIISIHPAKH